MDARDLRLTMAVYDANGKGHAWYWRMSSQHAQLTATHVKEINHLLKYGRKYIMLDLKKVKTPQRTTNPFAWSPGPTQ